MMRDKKIFIVPILILVVFILFFSCREKNRQVDTIRIVQEWTGKEIRFPENVQCYAIEEDTFLMLPNNTHGKEFNVLVYVDSTGCSSCRLKLFEWKPLIKEASKLFQGKLEFKFYIQPKDEQELFYLLESHGFDYPVFIDINNIINQINHFPSQSEYQCFLLDKDNKVLVVGNPVLNSKIWELYKQIIIDKVSSNIN